MELFATSVFTCSRCKCEISDPTYLCDQSHLACEKCMKVFCQICRHLFYDRRQAILQGQLTPVSCKRIFAGSPYQPNDGTIEFGKVFFLPQKGQCRFYAVIDDRQYKFCWRVNPQEGVVEVIVSPKEVVLENWFLLEFSCPSDTERKVRKEWAVNHRMLLDYNEIKGLYDDECILCTIFVQVIPYGKAVKPIEDKVKDAIASIFKFKKSEYQYEAL